ncbi:glycosyltransferase [Stutzerimonas tarimensis]|uniref:Glycosyltransferase n=1 Tax=Stutzerimonas tarimensis TaxID=1507735 RepID=A0ABV7T1A8_9GAMM
MAHIAVISPPFASHFRALQALAGRLVDQGHRVTFVQQADCSSYLDDPRIGFAAVGKGSHPPGSLAGIVARAARPGDPLGLRRVILDLAHGTDMLCREGPAALRALGVDALIADQMEAAGGLLGEALELPWVSVACALPINREPRLPLPVMPWGYADAPFGEQLNRGSSQVYDRLMAPHARVIAAHADALGLPPRQALHQCLSPYAQISQTVPGFDFPRAEVPAHFHALGPLRPAETAPHAELDLPRSGRPLVFASLGTLQGGRFRLFRKIARACRTLDLQLLVAHCGRLDGSQARRLEDEGATWVTDFAPQQTALAMADLTITHAGLNTVMDALVAGTPMLALPIAFDQPGVAARVVHHGVGLRALPALASRAILVRSLRRLLDEPQFASRAAALGQEVSQAGGIMRAAAVIEAVLSTGRPVEARDAA